MMEPIAPAPKIANSTLGILDLYPPDMPYGKIDVLGSSASDRFKIGGIVRIPAAPIFRGDGVWV
jgi:hypothetical protein